jgi:hypothetical protein
MSESSPQQNPELLPERMTETIPADLNQAFNALKESMMAVEVELVTKEHEIRGLIFVSREAKPERRLTELLNDQSKRFLSVVDAELIQRHQPSSPRRYAFLQVHLDHVQMIHPVTEIAMRRAAVEATDNTRFDELRSRMNKVSNE